MRKLTLILIIFGNLIIYDGNDLYFLWDLMMAVLIICGISYTAYTWSKLSFGLLDRHHIWLSHDPMSADF